MARYAPEIEDFLNIGSPADLSAPSKLANIGDKPEICQISKKTSCAFCALYVERPSPERRRRGSGQILEVSEAGRAVLIRAHLVLFVSSVGFWLATFF
ncbi:MAG: hypothetical protein ACU0AU_08760, partial [Cognatishimia activa]